MKTSIRLKQLNQRLSRFKLYNMLKGNRIVVTVLFFFSLIYLLWNYNGVDESFGQLPSFTTEKLSNTSWVVEQFKTNDDQIEIKKDKKFIFINNKYKNSKGYEKILNNHDPEDFVDKSLVQKCNSYFKSLYEEDPDWVLESLENSKLNHNMYIFDTKEAYLEDKKNRFKDSLENKDSITDDELETLIRDKGKKFEWDAMYNDEFTESFNTEQYIADQMTNLRVFHQCYLENDEVQAELDALNKNITCDLTEKKLFRFLTREFPTYTRWNNETLTLPPIINDYLNYEDYQTTDDNYFKLSGCFTKDLKNTYNGKGLVVSAADFHIDELSSLLLVLRAVKNKLPIQIVHRGDLSTKSQNKLTKVARSEKLNLNEITNFRKMIKDKFEDVNDLSMDSIFPKQEIWYVNASAAINPKDERFITYGNKLLSLLLSSFEDTVLIDTDTVPFVDIDTFILQSSVYQDLGAFFFKDRQLYDRMSGPEITLFKKLLPTRLDSAFFGIPELTNFTMNNRFFGEHFKHIQESGLVAINKKRHFRSTLIINALQMFHAITTRVHGDKELFWLGFSISGDEDYYFNKYGVGAVGQLNPNSNRLLGDSDDSRRSKLISHMVCTTHPAHLSGLDDHTLLWMNSGFITCKRPDEATKDIKMDLYKNVFKDEHELRRTYYNPLKIEAIIVPPPQEYIVNNDLGEPSVGWEVMFGCGGYLYCAYDSVGASNLTKHHGVLVEYDSDQISWFDYLGDVWVNYEKVINIETQTSSALSPLETIETDI